MGTKDLNIIVNEFPRFFVKMIIISLLSGFSYFVIGYYFSRLPFFLTNSIDIERSGNLFTLAGIFTASVDSLLHGVYLLKRGVSIRNKIGHLITDHFLRKKAMEKTSGENLPFPFILSEISDEPGLKIWNYVFVVVGTGGIIWSIFKLFEIIKMNLPR